MHEAKFRAGWEAVNRRDIDSVLDLLCPKIVWDMSGGFPDGPVYDGYEGVRRFFEDVHKLWADFKLEMSELHQTEDEVVVVGHWSARGLGSSVPVRSPGGWYWRLRHGKAVLMRFYNDPTEALARLYELAPAVPGLQRGQRVEGVPALVPARR